MAVHLDASTARRWFDLALRSLAAARQSLDALNVFPVPDADTGSNVVRTLSAGARSAQELPADATLGELAAALAEGSLWGARGNSGVILAQSLQAIAQTFEGLEIATGDDVIRAFDALASAATSAVAEPAEGTIITVAREVAATAVEMPPGAGVDDVVAAALAAAYEATDATTSQLPVLAETGKVDAGAVCLVIIIEALAEVLGLPVTPHDEWFPAPGTGPADSAIAGYEVMYILRAGRRDAKNLQRRLTQIGEAVVVVRGAGDLWHVHVHLAHPEEALADGDMSQVVVRRLDIAGRPLGIVATTTAPGLLEPLAEAGAVAVLSARARTIARAIIDTGARDVVVLPCSADSAVQAGVASRHETVIAEDISVSLAPTRGNLAVLDAVALLAPSLQFAGGPRAARGDADAALARLGHAQAGTRQFSSARADLTEAELLRAAQELAGGGAELLTVLAGASPAATPAAHRIVNLVRALEPDVEAYVLRGGQALPALEASAQ
ncbi:MAG TPA: DAK2 domain-containing protein [Actinomycetaceae bacterium]|nr:DAK2 domain-containing protein [Actinomycetaceae bacterium]